MFVSTIHKDDVMNASDPDLKETLALCDHVCQALSGSQVLTQVFLVWTACSVLPLDGPLRTEIKHAVHIINHVISL